MVATLKKFYGRHHDLVNPYNVAVSRVDFQNPGHMLLHTFPSFRPMGMVGEACFFAYQVMLTIRGRLITPFILGSMSVGLNILICQSFTNL